MAKASAKVSLCKGSTSVISPRIICSTVSPLYSCSADIVLAIVLNTFLSGTLSSMFCNLTFNAVKNTQKGLQLYFLVLMNMSLQCFEYKRKSN